MKENRGQTTVEYMVLLAVVVFIATIVFKGLGPVLQRGSDAFAKKIQDQFGKGVYQFRVK